MAHLTGWDMPRPAPAFITSLRAMDARLRDCALSHAADAAVAARAPAIAARVSPAAVAAHVAGAMRQVISDGKPGCALEEPDYLAPPYRWMLVRAQLRAAAPGEGRHPRSDDWEDAYGQPIPGATIAQQLLVINRRYARDQRDTRAVGIVAWGTRARPAIEQCVGTRADSDDWAAWLDDALTAFARLPWPRVLLTLPGSAPRQTAGEHAADD